MQLNFTNVTMWENASLRTEQAFFWCGEIDISTRLFGWGGSGRRVQSRGDWRQDSELRTGWPGIWMGDLTSKGIRYHQRDVFSSSSFLKTLFIWERERERKAQAGGGAEGEADSPLSKKPNAGLIPGPWDHDLSWRQMLNHWATQLLYLNHWSILVTFYILCEVFSEIWMFYIALSILHGLHLKYSDL